MGGCLGDCPQGDLGTVPRGIFGGLSPGWVWGLSLGGFDFFRLAVKSASGKQMHSLVGFGILLSKNFMTDNVTDKCRRTEDLAGQVTTTAGDCCRKVFEKQPDGSTMTRDYDGENRPALWERIEQSTNRTIVGARMIAKIFCLLSVVFIEWEVVRLLITVFLGMLNAPDEDVINDNLWTRMPTFIMVHTIFGTVTLSWWQYVWAIVVLQLLVIVACVAKRCHSRR